MSKILVIDDDPTITQIITTFLSKNGHVVHVEENGWNGIETARETFPDLIICDINMPNLDGFAVLECLKADPITEIIPFIFLTGKKEPECMRRGMERGAEDYLTKPFTRDELINTVKARLEKQDAWKRKLQSDLNELRKNVMLSLPHELHTPLNGIIGLASLLRDENFPVTPEEVREMASMIYASGERLNRITTKYIHYIELEDPVRSPENQAAYRNERLDLQKEQGINLGDVIEEAATQAARRNHRMNDLVLHIQAAPSGIYYEDLKEIIIELADNAFKFSCASTPVDIECSVADGQSLITISNRGRGISPADISSLGAFMQFERKKYEQQGMGMGIAIVKRLLQIYDGELSFKSIPNECTKASVKLAHKPDHLQNRL